MDDALSPRQEAFCAAYLRLGSAAAAARRAGYSPAAAKSQGWRLLRDPRIRARLDSLRRQAGTPAGANANGAVDLATLMAKLDSVYDAACERREFTAAVRAVEAQARLLERFGMLASAGETAAAADDPGGPGGLGEVDDGLDGDPPEDHAATHAAPDAPEIADDDAAGATELAPVDLLDHPPGHAHGVEDPVCEPGQHERLQRVAFDRTTVDLYRPRLSAKLRRIAAEMLAQAVEKWERKLDLATLRAALC